MMNPKTSEVIKQKSIEEIEVAIEALHTCIQLYLIGENMPGAINHTPGLKAAWGNRLKALKWVLNQHEDIINVDK